MSSEETQSNQNVIDDSKIESQSDIAQKKGKTNAPSSDDFVSSDDDLDALLKTIASEAFEASEKESNNENSENNQKLDQEITATSTKKPIILEKPKPLKVKGIQKRSLFGKLTSSFKSNHDNHPEDKKTAGEELKRLQQKKFEQERLKKERLKQEQLELERLEEERIKQEQLELERLEKKRIKQKHLELERLEEERIKQEQLELERLEEERIKQEQLELERLEEKRLNKDHQQQINLINQTLEKTLQELIQLERKRLKQKHLQQVYLEKESLKKEHQQLVHLEKERLKKEFQQQIHLEKERLNKEFQQQVHLEKERLSKEFQQQVHLEKNRLEQELQEQVPLEEESQEQEQEENIETKDDFSSFDTVVKESSNIIGKSIIETLDLHQITAERCIQLCGNNKDIDANNIEDVESISFSPNIHMLSIFLENLMRAKASFQIIKLVLKDTNIIIDHTLNTVYCNKLITSEEFAELCYSPTSLTEISVSELEYHDIKTYKARCRNEIDRVHSIQSFIWTASLLTSRGNLPIDTDLIKTIGLKEGLNFDDLEKIPYVHEIFTLLDNHPCNLLEVAEQLEIPQRFVFSFYNAVLSLDKVKSKTHTTSKAKKTLSNFFHK